MTSPALLERSRLDRATAVVIATGSDSRSLQVLGACEQALHRARRKPSLHVELESPELWTELHRIGFTGAGRTSRVEFFLPADRIARNLLEGASACSPLRTLLVHGEGSPLDRLLLHAGRATGLDGRPLLVIPVGPVIPKHIEPPAAAVVCGLPDAEAIAAGTGLARRVGGIQIFVAISSELVSQALDATRLLPQRVTLVPSTKLGSALIRESAIEIVARAKHEDYVAKERSRGGASGNPSLVPWDELPDSLKTSNRRYAESVGAKLREIGATLVPLEAERGGGHFALDRAELDELARGEHERWMAERREDGWRKTKGERDPERRLHPSLVPWDDLSEHEQEKDRDGFRSLPSLLARVGYALRRETDLEVSDPLHEEIP